ncbi:MAG: pantetheine-phosphate adenylyltransferase [Campylobacterales bacterium]|nr:pantetheine-phosphate adenylyltransferase [Campylobacterales bacterium]
MSNFRRAIYPGTFDPITNGHLDIIRRACKMFDEIIIAVAVSESKRPRFTLDQRMEMIRESTGNLPKIKVISFSSLLVDLADEVDAYIIVRGLRAISDFEYELQMGYANASLNSKIETIYLMPNLDHAFISSSMVRSILHFNGKIDHLLPPEAHALIKSYL